MDGKIIGFMIWSIVGVFFIGLGISSFLSKKAIGFWANSKMFEVNDTRKYNYAMGKLWCAFGIVFVLLGLPLLDGQNSPLILISVLGVLIEVIALMIIYTQVIEKKYRSQ